MFNLLMSDFSISNEPIPEHVVDMIYLYHFKPLDTINQCSHLQCYPSLESCFRPYWWEKARNRSGGSQHCFGQKKDGTFDKSSKGACDITCDDFESNKDDLLELLLTYSKYTRLAIYNGFIHGDYKNKKGGVQIFKSNSSSEWTYLRTV